MKLPARKRKRRLVARVNERKAERVTVGLAVFAAGSAGTLITGELLRMARRRRDSKEAQTPESIAEAAGHATRDTLAVARRGIIATPHHETVLFNILQGFLGAFAFARLATWGIRQSWWPSGNIHVSGRHIHHFVPGIVMAFVAGAAAILTREEGLEPVLAVPFGVGMGLTLDESALLLDLEDVYWTREGLLSVQITLAVMAMLGALALALRFLWRGEQVVLDSAGPST
jgi:hypothetical protein